MASIPPPTSNPPPFLHLPNIDDIYRSDWFAIQDWSQTITPYACCYNPTVSIPTLVHTGGTQYVSWTPTANQDQWNFLGQSDATWIRFPYDGLYDLYWNITFGTNLTNAIEMQTFIDYAQTSNTGYSAPAFISGTANPVRGYFPSGSTFRSLTAVYLDYPAVANDIARVGISISSSAVDVAGALIPMSSFRLAMPIPYRTQSTH